jgi:hypothetical protein
VKRCPGLIIDESLVNYDPSPDAVFAMYKNTFLLKSDEVNEAIISIVLQYNLALTNHALGFTKGSSFLQSALKLYEKVFWIVSRHGEIALDAQLLLLTCISTHSYLICRRHAC